MYCCASTAVLLVRSILYSRQQWRDANNAGGIVPLLPIMPVKSLGTAGTNQPIMPVLASAPNNAGTTGL